MSTGARVERVALALIAAVGLSAAPSAGQGGPGAAGAARAVAPKDLTGYWVSVVAEHWHLRMRVPPKGEFAMLPLNAEARRIANTWNPEREAADQRCRPYGAAAIMRVPGRLHIQWADDNTLQVDIDSGTQRRLLRFGAAALRGGQLEWQGHSVAEWDGIPTAELRARTASSGEDVRGGLKVVTTRMRPGYLRRNGVPYSQNAVLEEYYDRFNEPNGDEWLVVDSIVTDPQYLTQPYVTGVAFRKEPDGSKWDPTTCRPDQAR